VNPWRNSLLHRRITLPLPPMLLQWADFLQEFEGKFLDPNEIENAGRALMTLKQIRSAREFAQEFDRLAEMARLTGGVFLLDQFRRNLKPGVQEKLLQQNIPNLQDLQVTPIEWDNTLFQFKKQQRMMEQKRPPSAPKPQPKAQGNRTPMDLDFTKLSPEETDRRKKEGLCFCCGKPGHLGRNCPNNKNKKGFNQPKENYTKIAAMERTLSPISEDTYLGENETVKDFHKD